MDRHTDGQRDDRIMYSTTGCKSPMQYGYENKMCIFKITRPTLIPSTTNNKSWTKKQRTCLHQTSPTLWCQCVCQYKLLQLLEHSHYKCGIVHKSRNSGL